MWITMQPWGKFSSGSKTKPNTQATCTGARAGKGGWHRTLTHNTHRVRKMRKTHGRHLSRWHTTCVWIKTRHQIHLGKEQGRGAERPPSPRPSPQVHTPTPFCNRAVPKASPLWAQYSRPPTVINSSNNFMGLKGTTPRCHPSVLGAWMGGRGVPPLCDKQPRSRMMWTQNPGRKGRQTEGVWRPPKAGLWVRKTGCWAHGTSWNTGEMSLTGWKNSVLSGLSSGAGSRLLNGHASCDRECGVTGFYISQSTTQIFILSLAHDYSYFKSFFKISFSWGFSQFFQGDGVPLYRRYTAQLRGNYNTSGTTSIVVCLHSRVQSPCSSLKSSGLHQGLDNNDLSVLYSFTCVPWCFTSHVHFSDLESNDLRTETLIFSCIPNSHRAPGNLPRELIMWIAVVL